METVDAEIESRNISNILGSAGLTTHQKSSSALSSIPTTQPLLELPPWQKKSHSNVQCSDILKLSLTQDLHLPGTFTASA